MVQIKRKNYSVIVYDEELGRGITFPTSKMVSIDQFVQETEQIAASDEIRLGTVLVPLVFNPNYEENYRPMKEFLGKRNSQMLKNNRWAKELYHFYFRHSIPEISPGTVRYIYMGKDYHSRIRVTMR